jgi:hypothetical protein
VELGSKFLLTVTLLKIEIRLNTVRLTHVVAHRVGAQGHQFGLDIARGVGVISLMNASASNDGTSRVVNFSAHTPQTVKKLTVEIQCDTLDRLAIVRPLWRLTGTVDAAFEPRAARISLSAANQCCSASPSREPLATHISYARARIRSDKFCFIFSPRDWFGTQLARAPSAWN